MAPRTIYRFDEQRISQVLSRKKDLITALVGLFLAIGGSAYGAPRTSGLWWMPDVASKSGEQIDQLTYFIYYLTGGVFILTQVVYIYFLIRYRARRGVRAIYSHGHNRLEVVWTAVPTAIFIGLWGYSNHLWLNVIHREPPSDAMEVADTSQFQGRYTRLLYSAISHLPGCGSGADHRLGMVHSDKNRKLPTGLQPA